jgi:hypothetical protein
MRAKISKAINLASILLAVADRGSDLLVRFGE